jgi:AraC family transcriptional regulator
VSDDARAAYDARMHRVLAYVDAHLDRPLPLEVLAAQAHFSPFHFHRLFTAWAGETVADYVRRRRVELGAMRLAAQPRLGVLQVALDVGFGSGEAFARAFRARFGCSPTAWRRQERKISQADRNRRQAALAATGHPPVVPQLEPRMTVRLVDRPPVRIAYHRRVGPYGPALNAFWETVAHPWIHAHGLAGRPFYGISHDDPGVTDPTQCRYDAGVEVPADFPVVAPALEATLPGGRYAVLDFRGTAAQIGDAWTALLRDWLPASGYSLDARPCFEHYPKPDFGPGGLFSCEVCAPVVPLGA